MFNLYTFFVKFDIYGQLCDISSDGVMQPERKALYGNGHEFSKK